MSIDHQTQDYQLVAAAIRYLEENHEAQPELEELAAHLAVSPFHFQRVFKRWAGISPKRFLQFLTVEHAKELLAASHSVLDATYAAGLSGPSRLHDHFVAVEAMTPGEFKAGGRGLTIGYGVHASPFGECLVAATARGLCGLTFMNGGGAAAEIDALHARWPNAQLVADPAATAPLIARIFAAAAGGTADRPIPLLLAGTNFQIKVWEALLRVPLGNVCSYEEVAQAIGQPAAARAVGSAVGANAIGFLIPCHRVIRKSGVVREYRWGATRKWAILGWEAAQLEQM